MSDDFMKRFAAGLNNQNIEAELLRLGIKLLDGKPLSRPGVAWDGALGKARLGKVRIRQLRQVLGGGLRPSVLR